MAPVPANKREQLFIKGPRMDKALILDTPAAAPSAAPSAAPQEERNPNRPAYIDREPAAGSSIDALRAGSTIVPFPTRSNFRTLPCAASHMSLQASFDYAQTEAIACFNNVVDACKANGDKPFLDISFFLGHRKNLYPEGSPDDCTVAEPKTIVRAEELYPTAKLFDGRSNFDVDADDIAQGQTGDCFMLAAIASLAFFSKKIHELRQKDPTFINPLGDDDPIKRLFVAHDVKRSVYAVMFFGVGYWEWVIIDGTIAGDIRKHPLYANCNPKEPELWPFMIEKAYFKLFCSVDACDGGITTQALSTLSGGCELPLDLDRLKFDKLLQVGNDPLNVLGCGLKRGITAQVAAEYPPPSGPAGACGEERGPGNLVAGHAYTTIAIKITSDKKGFFNIRNPWSGAGGDFSTEWDGPYCDKSHMWKKNPHHKQELGFVEKDDGAFWMPAADFQKLMRLSCTSFFSSNSQLLTMSAAFSNTTNDVYMLKIDPKTKKCQIRVIIGQYGERWAPAVLGESKQSHLIAKCKTDWEWVSPKLTVSVFNHGKSCPLPANYPSSKKTTIGSRSANWAETAFIDVEAVDGYISITPLDLTLGCPYYIRVVAPPELECTVFRLVDGLAGAVGKTDFKIRIDKPKPGTDHPAQPAGPAIPGAGIVPLVPGKPVIKPPVQQIVVNPTGPGVVIPAPKPKPQVPATTTTTTTTDPDQNVVGPTENWWEDDEEYEEYEEGEEGEEEEGESEWSDDWYADDDDAENEDDGWGEIEGYDPANDCSDEDEEEEEAEEQEDVHEVIGGMRRKELKKNFNQFDTDGSGYLEKSECMSFIVHYFPEASPSKSLKIIKQYDANQDGKISFKEFKDILRDVFAEDDDEEEEEEDDE